MALNDPAEAKRFEEQSINSQTRKDVFSLFLFQIFQCSIMFFFLFQFSRILFYSLSVQRFQNICRSFSSHSSECQTQFCQTSKQALLGIAVLAHFMRSIVFLIFRLDFAPAEWFQSNRRPSFSDCGAVWAVWAVCEILQSFENLCIRCLYSFFVSLGDCSRCKAFWGRRSCSGYSGSMTPQTRCRWRLWNPKRDRRQTCLKNVVLSFYVRFCLISIQNLPQRKVHIFQNHSF